MARRHFIRLNLLPSSSDRNGLKQWSSGFAVACSPTSALTG